MYERLTARTDNNLAYLLKVKDDEQAVESKYPNTLKAILESFGRLAEFEDIGLSPDEIIGMKSLCEKTYDDLRHRVNTAEKEVEQLRAELERTKAERDAAVGDVEKMMAQDFHFVRCKYCEYWQDNNGGYPNEECRWGHDETPDADDFCSFGKRLEVEP